ncbi:MAG: sensor domain-containing diguanylate cyclase [Elusimicrobia bacterium]|jgi:diguanylate cyclase (GGDEF)-like protein|nr:sensor domain-containing diguanylate cyclase [Elusimicrobiota bacterium]
MIYLRESLLIIAFFILGTGFLAFKHIKRLKAQKKKMQDAINDLKLLQEVSKDVSSKLEMGQLLPAVMDAFVRAGNVKKGSIMLYDNEKDLLEIKAAKGLSQRAIDNVKLRLGEGIGGRVAETGESILINDTTKNSIYKDFFAGGKKARPHETLLCLPLIFKGGVLGVVTLDSKITGQQFIRNDERLLSILASQTAVSINNARMYEMAITDGLTKLYIRRYFFNRLEEEIEKSSRYGHPLSLLFLDIDHFKEFNDTYGHQMGDKALIHLSKVMVDKTRNVDICARYGGEEFIIILPETPKDAALILAKRLRKSIEVSSFTGLGQEYKLTVSIGLAEYTSNMTSKDIIKEADKNLYKAKDTGRNKVVS